MHATRSQQRCSAACQTHVCVFIHNTQVAGAAACFWHVAEFLWAGETLNSNMFQIPTRAPR
jgi:hypothetical protein